jgi:hypothetical protein
MAVCRYVLVFVVAVGWPLARWGWRREGPFGGASLTLAIDMGGCCSLPTMRARSTGE